MLNLIDDGSFVLCKKKKKRTLLTVMKKNQENHDREIKLNRKKIICNRAKDDLSCKAVVKVQKNKK